MWSHQNYSQRRKIAVFNKLTGSLQKQLQKNPENTASRRYHHSVRSCGALYTTLYSVLGHSDTLHCSIRRESVTICTEHHVQNH